MFLITITAALPEALLVHLRCSAHRFPCTIQADGEGGPHEGEGFRLFRGDPAGNHDEKPHNSLLGQVQHVATLGGQHDEGGSPVCGVHSLDYQATPNECAGRHGGCGLTHARRNGQVACPARPFAQPLQQPVLSQGKSDLGIDLQRPGDESSQARGQLCQSSCGRLASAIDHERHGIRRTPMVIRRHNHGRT